MIEATFKLTEEDQKYVKAFENKLNDEFAVFWENAKNWTAEEAIKKCARYSFMVKMQKYFLADNFSLNKIIQLTHEYKLLEHCYKQVDIYKKQFGTKPKSLRTYVRMVMEDNKY